MAAPAWRPATRPVLLALLVLSACASDAPAPTARPRDPLAYCVPELPAGQGRIWIYRTAPKSPGVPPDVVVDQRVFDRLVPGLAYTIDVAPGRHQVQLAYDKDVLALDVQVGEDHFVRFDKDPDLFGRGFYPVRVERKTALAEIQEHTGTDPGCVKPRVPAR